MQGESCQDNVVKIVLNWNQQSFSDFTRFPSGAVHIWAFVSDTLGLKANAIAKEV